MSMLLPEYQEGARRMQAAGHQYRVEAPGNGRMILYLTDAHGEVAAYDLPMESMVSIGRHIMQVYDVLLEQALDKTEDETEDAEG